jgi:hypothetical protein
MDCALILPDLVSYHFGEASHVEEHLLECKDCLRAYLKLKRQIDAEPQRPSPRVRASLVAEVRALRRRSRRRIVAIAVAAAIAALVPFAAQRFLSKQPAAGIVIDTSAESTRSPL